MSAGDLVAGKYWEDALLNNIRNYEHSGEIQWPLAASTMLYKMDTF